MAEEWRDLDGIEKNIDKMKKEWSKVKEVLVPEWKRFLKSPFDTHSYVNLFVEARRVSPYFTGHVDAMFYPCIIVIAVVGWIL